MINKDICKSGIRQEVDTEQSQLSCSQVRKCDKLCKITSLIHHYLNDVLMILKMTVLRCQKTSTEKNYG